MARPRVSAGGGVAAIAYALRKGREAGGLWRLYRRMRHRNACKTCALGMGGQRGGMVNEAGHFPEVCKKSLQAQAADMQGADQRGVLARARRSRELAAADSRRAGGASGGSRSRDRRGAATATSADLLGEALDGRRRRCGAARPRASRSSTPPAAQQRGRLPAAALRPRSTARPTSTTAPTTATRRRAWRSAQVLRVGHRDDRARRPRARRPGARRRRQPGEQPPAADHAARASSAAAAGR